ncbi:cytochrome c peroxidase [Telmatobacter sp. DSM 110680]|uniref:Cytochrome c peroxidase n=1 Tax=Telmatobacter sp. DSM 110680 TaxID=3036704 RepID=A0AAU7DL62_9BACT
MRIGKVIHYGMLALLLLGSKCTASNEQPLDAQLRRVLQRAGFTGRIESTLESRLGRSVNPALAELGRLLFFDKAGAVHKDNMCAGCHAPSNGMGDSQTMAIGIQNNDIVGPNRTGPRNQRRTPSIVNTVFYPKLMWNGRFASASGNPFDTSRGFVFPPPEGTTEFPANDPRIPNLASAQGQMPPTELTEVAGFTGTTGKFDTASGLWWVDPSFWAFDDGKGDPLPPPVLYSDPTTTFLTFNDPIRRFLLANRLNDNPTYIRLFRAVFPTEMAANGGKIDFSMFGRAIAEFEFSMVFANAPIDQFARGDVNALDTSEKRGALLFFGKAKCVACHAVTGASNEMFSDFRNRVIGVPQVSPLFGPGLGNVHFDGAGNNEDFGLEQVSGNSDDRYKFRTAPLRNLAVAAGFFHNGAFARLDDAIAFHLDPKAYAPSYDPTRAGLDPDLTFSLGPIEPVLDRIDPLMRPVHLTPTEFKDLVHFIRDGLLDVRATKTCSTIPASVPSGLALPQFQGCNN